MVYKWKDALPSVHAGLDFHLAEEGWQVLGVEEPTRFPPDYARMTPHREVEGSGEETLEEEGVGGEPLEEEEVGGEATGAKNSGPCPK